MTDDEREVYQRNLRELAAEYRAQRPAARPRTIRERIAALLGRQPKVPVAPKARRISGPMIKPTDWHEPQGQALLVHRCFACREEMLPGSTIRDTGGLCGPCSKHSQGTAMPDDRPAA